MDMFHLPDGYRELKSVNMQKDKKLAVFVNVLALVIAVLLFLIGNKLVYVLDHFASGDMNSALFRMVFLLVSVVLYLFAHELIHGIFIKKYSGKKAKYGFTGLYAYAGSDAFFNKRQYGIIALAPVAFFGALCLALNLFLPSEFFWPVYFIQIINLSGAAGDFYITWLAGRMPADVLIRDEGVSMTMFSAELSL